MAYRVSSYYLSLNRKWESIFPNEQLTEQKSTVFVKKLLAVAISNITYLRDIFPEHAFGDKCLEDLNLKILREDSSCPGACQVIRWVKGCFDALDKKYLRTLAIGIYVDPNNPATVIESYTFRFTYNNDGEVDIYRNNKKISSAHSAEETKKATIKLLRTLIVLTNTLTPLPDGVMMTMKLFYYDEVTPGDYEPPGFKASSDNTFIFAEKATNIGVGEVSTMYNFCCADISCKKKEVKLRVKTDSKQFELDENPHEEMEQVDEDSLTINNSGLDIEANSSASAVQEVTCEKSTATSASEEQQVKSCSAALSHAEVDNSTTADNFQVRCPCGCNEDDGLMVMCSNCQFWQHGICFLITTEDMAPAVHICDVCAKYANSKLVPTDPYLSSISSIAVQATCLWRRALSACLEFKQVIVPQLARRLGIESTVAHGLINRLEKEGYVSNSKKNKKLGKLVHKDKIESDGYERYLKPSLNLTKPEVPAKTDPPMNAKAFAKGLSITKGKTTDKSVDVLVEKTNQINIHGSKPASKTTSVQKETVTSSNMVETKGRRGKKRAHSKTDNMEFEVTDSQEMLTAKKKASTVTQDIPV